jgi:3-oxoacyl-[acyl-carrier protein] reductase
MPSDRYQQLTATPPGKFIARRLGLPESRPLRRYEPGQPALAGPALIGGEGRMGDTLAAVLAAIPVAS